MDLQKLFEMQAGLDFHIEKEHPVQEGEDRLAKKILALQVELGELANEWRGFKFWSNDQEPRTKVTCQYCDGRGYFDTGLIEDGMPYTEGCVYCQGTGYEEQKNPLLEEFVDCLHFLLSVGLEITEPDMLDLKRFNLEKADNITDQFLWLMADVTDLYNSLYNDGNSKLAYEFLLLRFIYLGEMLGFTWDEIEQGYLEKNRINHERQLSNY